MPKIYFVDVTNRDAVQASRMSRGTALLRRVPLLNKFKIQMI